MDLFTPRDCAQVKGSNGIWILTHFHSDHYKGLSKNFKLGRILCSTITAQLVHTKLKVGSLLRRGMQRGLTRQGLTQEHRCTLIDEGAESYLTAVRSSRWASRSISQPWTSAGQVGWAGGQAQA